MDRKSQVPTAMQTAEKLIGESDDTITEESFNSMVIFLEKVVKIFEPPRIDSESILDRVVSGVRSENGSFDDVYRMVQICAERGTNVEAMMKTSSASFTKTLGELRERYDLKISGKHSGRDLTLSRISLLFPHITCAYMKFCKNPTVKLSRMRNLSPGYPEYMMNPAFVCMIPRQEVYFRILGDAFMLYHYEFDAVINATNYRAHPKSKLLIIRGLYNDMKTTLNESTFEESMKTSYLVAWNILAPSDKLNGSLGVKKHVMDAAKAWTKFCRLEIGFDEKEEGDSVYLVE